MTTAVDLYSGSGGWCVAATALGIDVTGVEIDDACAKTRDAAGFETVHDDIRNLDPIPADGLIASPPCPTFSAAGRGSGRRNLDQVLAIAHKLVLGEDWWTMAKNEIEDERTALVFEPLHWVFEMRKAGTPYRWIAMEQVPPVLPVWEYYAELLRWMGYSASADVLHAEQFGVPQTRKRAILLASLDHDVDMPAPTHSKYYPRDPQRVDEGVEKWVSMAEALGWGMTRRPSTAVVTGNNGGGPDPMSGGAGSRATHARAQEIGEWEDKATEVVGFPRLADAPDETDDGVIEIDGVRYRSRDLRPTDRPAQHVTEKARSWQRWQFRQSAMENATVRDPDQPAPTITAAHDSGERVWMLSAGRTSPDTAGSRPRSEDEPSATMVARNVAIWLVNNTSAKAGVREAGSPAPTMYFGDRLNKAVWTDQPPAAINGGEQWPDRRPATTVNGDPRISKPGHHDENTSGSQQKGAVRVTPQEAAILQSFPPGFPFQGTKTSVFRQIGNAVPPLLALHVLAAALGWRLEIHVEQEEEQGLEPDSRESPVDASAV